MKKVIVSFIMIIAIIICSNTISMAGIQIIDKATTLTNVNVSESFDLCYNLRNGDSTLGKSNLEPHLTTSLDWGAVAYLSQSRYGSNATSLSSFNNTSTGNESGVQDTGGYMQTATMFETRNTTSSSATSYRYRLDEALQDENMKKYVNLIPTSPNVANVNVSNTLGMALAETQNWFGASYSFGNNTDYPVIIRDSLFGVSNYVGTSTGQANSNLTFRPVIWN